MTPEQYKRAHGFVFKTYRQEQVLDAELMRMVLDDLAVVSTTRRTYDSETFLFAKLTEKGQLEFEQYQWAEKTK